MTDDEKREKVILGLRCHKAGYYEECLNKCPYRDDGCETTLCNDAIALLVEQRPRVMSFNELKFDTVYWIELKDVMPWPVAMARMCGNPEYLVFVDYHGDKWDVSKYRIKEGGWRCWTSRPSPEQMRDTPWEETEND